MPRDRLEAAPSGGGRTSLEPRGRRLRALLLTRPPQERLGGAAPLMMSLYRSLAGRAPATAASGHHLADSITGFIDQAPQGTFQGVRNFVSEVSASEPPKPGLWHQSAWFLRTEGLEVPRWNSLKQLVAVGPPGTAKKQGKLTVDLEEPIAKLGLPFHSAEGTGWRGGEEVFAMVKLCSLSGLVSGPICTGHWG